MKECKHEITLKNICCLCGSETFTKNKQFCHLTTTEIIKSTTYQHKHLTLILDLDETIVNTTSISLFNIPINKLQEITYISSLNNLSTKEINLNNQSIIFDLIFKFNNFIYFIKLRKNAIKFLKKINFFKLYIFSMGTKEYVEIIKKYLNNQGINVCGSISREENMSFSKSVSRLGLSERRVVILDDRLDVWDYLDCVILVKPFLFYKNVKSVCEKSYEVNKKIKLEDMGVERKGVYLNKNVFVESESFLDEQTNCQNKNLTDCQHKNLTDKETNLTDKKTNLTDCQNKNLTKEESNFTNKETNLTDKKLNLTDCQNKNLTKEESNFTNKETNLTNEYLEYNLLDLVPLLKKVKKKFKKIKNTKKILKKERKKLFKNLQFHFYLNNDLILLGNFFKVKYIKNVNNFNILDDLILLRDKNKVFYVNKEWFYLCVYFRKMVDYKAFVFKESDYESEESFNEDEYL